MAVLNLLTLVYLYIIGLASVAIHTLLSNYTKPPVLNPGVTSVFVSHQ